MLIISSANKNRVIVLKFKLKPQISQILGRERFAISNEIALFQLVWYCKKKGRRVP